MASTRRWHRVAFAALAAAVLLGLGLVLHARSLDSRQIRAAPWSPPELDEDAIVERFRGAIRIPTISDEDPARFDVREFERFRAFLAESFPLMHAALERELVAEHTLLYTWPGRDLEAAPLLLMGHQDVVPVDHPESWSHAPFAADLADGFVWGRGTLDDKFHVLTVCEAVEQLLARGFRPERTVLLAFGHDEETGGERGAAAVARRLGERGIHPFLVVDEGSSVVEGVLPGFEGPIALVGVAEKGSLSLELVARLDGPAHSSIPPPHTPVGRLATAIHRLEADPFPTEISEPVEQMLAFVAPELPLGPRVVLGNRWLFGPLLRRAALGSPATAALVRTTTAATMFEGSSQDNVIASEARATVNLRILPGETVAGTEERVHQVIDDDSLELRRLGGREPSPASRTDSAGFAVLQRTLAETFPDAAVVPFLVLGGTDARYFHALSDSVFRFGATRLGPADLGLAHGVDERISVENLLRGVAFNFRLIENAAGAGAPKAAPAVSPP